MLLRFTDQVLNIFIWLKHWNRLWTDRFWTVLGFMLSYHIDKIHNNEIWASAWQWNLSQRMTKPTKWHMRPAKTQINLGIRPVWSVFAVHEVGS